MEEQKILDFISDENLEERLILAYNDLSIGHFGPAIGNWTPSADLENIILKKEILDNEIRVDIKLLPLDLEERKEWEDEGISLSERSFFIPKEYLLNKEKYLKKINLEKLKGEVWSEIEWLNIDIKAAMGRIKELKSCFNNLIEKISEE